MKLCGFEVSSRPLAVPAVVFHDNRNQRRAMRVKRRGITQFSARIDTWPIAEQGGIAIANYLKTDTVTDFIRRPCGEIQREVWYRNHAGVFTARVD